MKVVLLRLGLSGLFALGACSQVAPQATPADAQRANLQLSELEAGRTLMLRKCGGCHRPPMPSDHSPGAWPATLYKMAPRARLTPDERRSIQQYLVVLASRQ